MLRGFKVGGSAYSIVKVGERGTFSGAGRHRECLLWCRECWCEKIGCGLEMVSALVFACATDKVLLVVMMQQSVFL